MNDQQQSRADALTEAQRKALETAVNVLNINWEHETANELWEAFTAPVSQPAAALIEKPVAWRWREKIDERWRFTRHDPSQLVRRPKFIEPLYLNAQAAAAPINPIALAEQKMSNENAHANETGAEGLDQFERIDVQNHVLRRTLQRVMARLTDLLDEDQFGNIESIVKEAGVEPPAMAAATPDAEAVNWRELSRRLYVELFHCDQQMRSTHDEDGEPHWTQSAVVRDVLADAKAALDGAPQPAQADAPAEAREPAKVDTKARMDWAAGILRKLPPLDPTYSIISILDDHDPEDRDEVLHSIRVFADMRATQALFTLYRAPADSGEARLTDEQIETLAHRRAYRYRHGPDSIEFIFNRHCLLNFARALLERHAK